MQNLVLLFSFTFSEKQQNSSQFPRQATPSATVKDVKVLNIYDGGAHIVDEVLDLHNFAF